jgi:hypothetical protein
LSVGLRRLRANADSTQTVTGASAIKTLMLARNVVSAFALKRRKRAYDF